MGIVDLFQSHGLRAWGPNRQAAQFEASKVFAQDFMTRHGIPTAQAGVFTDPVAAKKFAESLGRCAVKADGLALGKGVVVCANATEASAAIDQMLVGRQFGEASSRVVIQEYLEGTEVSLHALCDGQTALLFPTSQDHKRAYDGDLGPNTGGMGTYSPTPFLDDAQMAQVQSAIMAPWLKGCAAEGIDYRGIIYPGIMLTAKGPKVLEFNARFGDPETQVYLARLANDLVELFQACLDGQLAKHQLRWKAGAAMCVVMASGGYPGNYAKGKVIQGLEKAAQLPDTKVFHAGTTSKNGQILTQGGRVLGVTAWGKDLPEARSRAYAAAQTIQFEGAMYRKDLAHRALNLK
jgi:phosphoribosylamine--glycine ligase